MRNSFDSPSTLLEWVGPPGISYEIATHTGIRGESFLHFAADALRDLPVPHWSIDHAILLDEWARLVSDLIKAGAEPSRLESSGRSPLLLALELVLNPFGNEKSSKKLEKALALVRIWTNALKTAGVDLVAFARCEGLIWRVTYNREASEREGLWPIRLFVDVLRETVSLELINRVPCWLQRSKELPGSWVVPSADPGFRLALAAPAIDVEDDDEARPVRRWRTSRIVRLESKPFEVGERLGLLRANEERVKRITAGSQDDAGPMVLVVARGRRNSARLRRSVSQRPCTHRWSELYWTPQFFGYYPWLWFHLCPRDHRWREECCVPGRSMSRSDCMGGRRRQTDLFDTIAWRARWNPRIYRVHRYSR